MVVTRDTPNANDIISQTQPLLLANNQDYVDKFAVDHVPYNDSGGGKHNKSTYPIQGSAPVTGGGEGAIYTKNSSVSSGRTDLYYKYQTSGGTDFTGVEFPLTNVKAFGKVDAGGLVAGTGFNIASVDPTLPTWTITFTQHVSANVIPAIYMVLLGNESTLPTPSTSSYTIVDSTHMILRRGGSDVSAISFYVIAL